MNHTFHIPVLGLGYSVDTPLKVARFGISSVVSVVDDILIERMRKLHTPADMPFLPIGDHEDDHRARRITAYLDLLKSLVEKQHADLLDQDFSEGADICKYFELLPAHSDASQKYQEYQNTSDPIKRRRIETELRSFIEPGSIDVNIMSKVDKMNYAKDGSFMGDIHTDALAALRGFANSQLSSALVLSAGMNPKLYGYLEEFPDFLPTADHAPKKKLILKVSDFRSALIQAKFLAKKGIWVHEFRVESGLNCGGHAFATEGFLLGPILEEFREKREQMLQELRGLYRAGLEQKALHSTWQPGFRVTVQGGIGTSEEDEFLLKHYQLDGTGWGSPFLLVPEATNVDQDTLNELTLAEENDFYISGASPLGIPFNNFRRSSAEKQRMERLVKGRPGSPCTKKFLVSNTEFTAEPICTASREYQKLKLEQLQKQDLAPADYQRQYDKVTEKVCLCVGLTTSAYIKNNILKPRENKAVTICPGPNTAYFKREYSLKEMVSHIYGRVNLISGMQRSHMFVNELKLYVEYLREDLNNSMQDINDKKCRQLAKFRQQLLLGIDYYHDLADKVGQLSQHAGESIRKDLDQFKELIRMIQIPGNTAEIN